MPFKNQIYKLVTQQKSLETVIKSVNEISQRWPIPILRVLSHKRYVDGKVAI